MANKQFIFKDCVGILNNTVIGGTTYAEGASARLHVKSGDSCNSSNLLNTNGLLVETLGTSSTCSALTIATGCGDALNVTEAGTLSSVVGDFSGSLVTPLLSSTPNQNLAIKSDKNVNVYLDTDDDGSFHKFQLYNGDGDVKFAVAEDGKTVIGGAVTSNSIDGLTVYGSISSTSLSSVETDDASMLFRFFDGFFLYGFILAWAEQDLFHWFEPEKRDMSKRDFNWFESLWIRILHSSENKL